MKFLAHISGAIAIISIILGVVTRIFFVNKVLFGLGALTYMRFANTMLLFTIAFLVFAYVKGK